MFSFKRASIACIAALAIAAGCADSTTRQIEVSAGDAPETLKAFAKQANIDIIFDAKRLSGIKTHAASGQMDTQTALNTMLTGTPLIITRDQATGAFAITRPQ